MQFRQRFTAVGLVMAGLLSAAAAPVAAAQPDPLGDALPDPTVDVAAAATAAADPAPAATATAADVDPAWRPREPTGHHLTAAFDLRLVHERSTAVDIARPLPTDPRRAPGVDEARPRLRVGAGWLFAQPDGFVRATSLTFEADAVRDYEPGRDAPDSVDDGLSRIRKAWLEVTTLAGQLGVGRTTSSWGLGLLAQSGDDEPMQFGVKRAGSLVDRVQYGLAPAAILHGGDPVAAFKAFPLVVAVAYDVRVVLDDLTADSRDAASNTVLAVLYRAENLELGAYGVLRRQRDVADLGLDARIADIYGKWRARVGRTAVSVAAEWLVLAGETTWFRTPTNPEKLDLLQHGGAVRFEAERGRVTGRLELGLTSGDARPFDDTLHNLKFASDYRVGLVLFPHFLRTQTETAAANLSDERFRADAPAGFERVRSRGAVTQAMYAHPVVRVRAFRRLSLLAGAVLARAPADVVDPYQTTLQGGVPTGPRGAREQRDLGVEFDGAAAWEQPLAYGLSLLARVDAGVLLPGSAFDDAAGDPAAAVGVVQGLVSLRGAWK